jgi:predicted metal-dependent phosphoesterase TrpH
MIVKFDLHCHTKEGSIDSRVSVAEYADRFMKMGYDGFMIADHNSYRGCRAWDAIKDDPKYSDLTVIRGIEYDTKDAGHVLVIMPDDVYLNILRIRGMRLRKLINLVHSLGGILGLAHPYGAAGSSAMGFKQMDTSLIQHVDFIETFNTCEFPESNQKAQVLAQEYYMPAFAGSDSHVTEYIGMACTEIDADIRCNNDLIRAVREGAPITAGGTERGVTKKAKRKEHWIGVLGFKMYNRGIAKTVCLYRKYSHHKLVRQELITNSI